MDERANVCARATLECVNVVPSLEHRDDRHVAAAERRHLRRQPAKVTFVQRERGEWVVGVRVEASRQEDGLRLEGAHRREKLARPRRAEGRRARAGRQRARQDLAMQPVAPFDDAVASVDARLE